MNITSLPDLHLIHSSILCQFFDLETVFGAKVTEQKQTIYKNWHSAFTHPDRASELGRVGQGTRTMF